MLPRQLSILPLVLLYLASGVKSSNVKIMKFNRTFEVNNRIIFAHDHSRFKYARDSSWTYASCDEFDSESDTSMKCSVVFETNKPDGRVYREICQIKLENPKPDNITEKHFRVFQFGSSKSIVVWQDRNNTVHFYTVHFPTCKIVEAKSTIDIAEPLFDAHEARKNNINVLVYVSDTYDVFYANRTLEKLVSYHRVSFDSEGNQLDHQELIEVKGTENSDETDYVGAQFFEVEDPDMGGYLMGTMDDKNVVTYWHMGKSDKRDKLISYTEFDGNVLHQVLLSTVNGIFGACHIYTSNATLTCEQKNRRGQRILSTNFETGYQYPYHQHWMYNLRGGGFLLFVWPCSNRPDCQNDGYMYVTKVDARGTRYRTLEVMSYQDDYYKARDGFFENGPGEFCWYELIAKEYEARQRSYGYTSEITYACFTEEMLSETYSL